MAESSLNMVWANYQAEVGSFLGWGKGAAYGDPAYTTDQQFKVDSIVASALRRFYFPMVPREQGGSLHYDWSFLHPVANLDFPQSAQTIALPDDYGAAEGPLTVLTTTITSQPWRIQWVNEGLVREKYAIAPEMQGPPMFAAVQVLKGTTATASNRAQLYLFPAADQTYTLQLSYFVNPDYLSTPFPYAYGGAQHAETILEACLAVAEERQDDQAQGTGPHARAFADRLLASVSMDRRNKPQRLGYNGDRSDTAERFWDRSNVHYWAPAATYNGNPFG